MLKLTQNSWLGGQLDPELSGRQDVAKYRIGASELVNFLPIRRGSIVKRPGTDFVADVTDYVGASRFRLIPFGYLSERGCVLLLADRKARVYFSDGSCADVSGTIPYLGSELDEIGYVQCGDVLYLAHVNHPPAEIRHTAETTFSYRACPVNMSVSAPTIRSSKVVRQYVSKSYRGGVMTEKYAATAVVEIDGEEYESPLSGIWGEGKKDMGSADGEFDPSDSSKNNQSSWAGTTYYMPWTESQVINVTVDYTATSSAKVKEVRLYKDGGGTFGLVAVRKFPTPATESGSVTLTDSNIVPDTSVAPVETKKVFAAAGDYPGCVALYQQRLVWASTRNDPARVWMSAAGDFYENRPHESLQYNDPIDFILPITQFAKVNFIIELGKLLAFAEACELLIGSASDNAGINYETIYATTQSHIGCTKRLPPIVANNSVLYVERTGQCVRDYAYDIGQNLYGGVDVSVFSSSIFDENPIVDWTYQQHPNSTAWCVLADGSLASLVFMKDQDVCAWAVHRLGGHGLARGIAKTCALTGNDNAASTTSEVMLVVERDGVLTLERMRPWCREADTPANAVVMDCVREGEVEGMAYVEAAGVSGYPFESRMTTVHPVCGNDVGNAQFDVKNVQYAHLRMQNAVGGRIRAIDMPDAQASVLASTPVPEIGADGMMRFKRIDERVLLEGSNNRDGRVTLVQDAPWPFQLLLLEEDVEVEEGGAR